MKRYAVAFIKSTVLNRRRIAIGRQRVGGRLRGIEYRHTKSVPTGHQCRL